MEWLLDLLAEYWWIAAAVVVGGGYLLYLAFFSDGPPKDPDYCALGGCY